MWRKISALGCAVAMLFLCGCAGNHVYDSDEAIISRADGMNSLLSTETSNNRIYALEAKKFTGMRTVVTYTTQDSLTFDFSLSIAEGRAKLVLVDAEKVTVVIDHNFEGRLTVEGLNGSYKLKIVGDAAKLVFEFRKTTSG